VLLKKNYSSHFNKSGNYRSTRGVTVFLGQGFCASLMSTAEAFTTYMKLDVLLPHKPDHRISRFAKNHPPDSDLGLDIDRIDRCIGACLRLDSSHARHHLSAKTTAMVTGDWKDFVQLNAWAGLDMTASVVRANEK
jgi:hypothetical protein